MVFVPHTEIDRKAMLDAAGVDSVEALFAPIPSHLATQLDLPAGISEWEVERLLAERGAQNRKLSEFRRFVGGGIYEHWIPPEVPSLAGRREFMTAYTPYQSEASQGTLKAIFEYQTTIAALTGMEASNASVYDGATAVVEGCFLALRHTRRNAIAVSPGLNPRHQQVLRAYLEPQGFEIRPLEFQNGKTNENQIIGNDVAAVVIQNPNAFGIIESLHGIVEKAHEAGALVVASVNPISLGILASPGEAGADIAVGEGQPMGLPPAYGGMCFGFMACTKPLVRKLPGRIVGEAQDKNGRTGYTLTLQAREQHIRREKATSNICTNQALFALHATVYLSCMGPQGMREVATLCLERTALLRERLLKIPGVETVFDAPVFHEWAYRTPRPAEQVLAALHEKGILGGVELGHWTQNSFSQDEELSNAILTCATELTTNEDIEAYGSALEEVLR